MSEVGIVGTKRVVVFSGLCPMGLRAIHAIVLVGHDGLTRDEVLAGAGFEVEARVLLPKAMKEF